MPSLTIRWFPGNIQSTTMCSAFGHYLCSLCKVLYKWGKNMANYSSSAPPTLKIIFFGPDRITSRVASPNIPWNTLDTRPVEKQHERGTLLNLFGVQLSSTPCAVFTTCCMLAKIKIRKCVRNSVTGMCLKSKCTRGTFGMERSTSTPKASSAPAA